MAYTEVLFRGRYLAKRRKEEFNNGMIFSAFSAWQILTSKGLDMPWEKYLIKLKLKKRKKPSKQQLEIEARIAMQNVERIQREAMNGSKTSI